MKTNMTGMMPTLNKEELKELTQEVKETIATGIKKSNTGNFGPLDLWRLQKKHKTLGSSTRW